MTHSPRKMSTIFLFFIFFKQGTIKSAAHAHALWRTPALSTHPPPTPTPHPNVGANDAASLWEAFVPLVFHCQFLIVSTYTRCRSCGGATVHACNARHPAFHGGWVGGGRQSRLSLKKDHDIESKIWWTEMDYKGRLNEKCYWSDCNGLVIAVIISIKQHFSGFDISGSEKADWMFCSLLKLHLVWMDIFKKCFCNLTIWQKNPKFMTKKRSKIYDKKKKIQNLWQKKKKIQNFWLKLFSPNFLENFSKDFWKRVALKSTRKKIGNRPIFSSIRLNIKSTQLYVNKTARGNIFSTWETNSCGFFSCRKKSSRFRPNSRYHSIRTDLINSLLREQLAAFITSETTLISLANITTKKKNPNKCETRQTCHIPDADPRRAPPYK